MRVKIYTRTGDGGMTSLYGGRRVEKHHLQVVAYGTTDELGSSLGLLISFLPGREEEIRGFLFLVQNDLFTIGGHLSGKKLDLAKLGKRVKEMEKLIDAFSARLAELKNFILPGGTKEASFSHLSRSICRRAEREVIRLSEEHNVVDKRVIVYLNRLSDLLFVVARYLNQQSGISDVVWQKK